MSETKHLFDRVEVTIRGYDGDKVLSISHCWTLEDLDKMLLSKFVEYKVSEIHKALSNEAKRLEAK